MQVRSLRFPFNSSETIYEDLRYNLRYKLGYTDSVMSKKSNEIKYMAESSLRSERTINPRLALKSLRFFSEVTRECYHSVPT